jgi:thiol-disulfide isomerase/thioredoxin
MYSRKSMLPALGGQTSQIGIMQKASNFFSFQNFDWKMTLISIVCGGLLILLGYWVYNQFFKSSPSYSASRDEDNFDTTKTANLMLFYTDWCPHCKQAKPEWESLKTEYDGKNINGYTLVMTEYDGENKTPEVQELLDKYDVQGWPTIKLVKDNQVIEYDAKPTKATLVTFLNTVL